ncbi:MAG: hypothetical protein LBK82_02075 [Planctomycetaceae bacterium]|nr:hypothetical protein [Planctomycetaceae bacterium]
MGDPFAEGSRRLSHHFAGVNLVHSRLSPTQPFSERLPTFFVQCHWKRSGREKTPVN